MLFNEILKAAKVHISSEINKFLTTPLLSTGKPPHYSFTADKATIGRKSNQAVLIGAVYEGKKIAIPVGAPLVYRTDIEEDETYNLCGGTAIELADTIIDLIRDELHLPEAMLSYISGKYVIIYKLAT